MLHSKHVRWCWSKGLFFTPIATNPYTSHVVIGKFENGRLTKGKLIFDQKNKKSQEQLYKKIDDLYLQVFERNN